MRIVPRAEWGSVGQLQPKVWWGAKEVITHTEGGARYGVRTRAQDAARMRAIDNWNRYGRGWLGGAGYNFVISPAGRVFEARGWGRKGTHTEGKNSSAPAVCFMGDGGQDPITGEALAAYRWLIEDGQRIGAIGVGDPMIDGHWRYSQTGKSCPGLVIRRQLQLPRPFRAVFGARPAPSPKPSPSPKSVPSPKPKDPFMALTDAQQADLLKHAKATHMLATSTADNTVVIREDAKQARALALTAIAEVRDLRKLIEAGR